MKKLASIFLSFTLIMSIFAFSASTATVLSAATLPTLSGTLISGVLTVSVIGAKAATYPQVNIVAVNNTTATPDLDPTTKKPAATVGTIQVGQNGDSLQFSNRKGSDYTILATTKNPDGSDGPQLAKIEIKPIVSTVIGVNYSTFLQKQGWGSQLSNGAVSGNTSHLLAIQALKMSLTGGAGLPKGAKITYKVYLHGHGWQNAVSNGTLAGSSKAGLAVEAVKISISGLTGYTVKYQVYLQSKKWLGWQTVKNGTNVDSAAASGAAGKNLKIQAIQIRIVKAA
jgi:uncharacterized protein YjdB